MNERKAFQYLSHEENPHHLENGKEIYKNLRGKYPNNSIEDLDSILNSLVAGLVCLISVNVSKDNHIFMIQLVHQILNKNLQ